MKVGDACPKCGGRLRECRLGDPDVHCETCESVWPIYKAEPKIILPAKAVTASRFNVRAIVAGALRERGCIVEPNLVTGIVKVTCPDGTVWDFTLPQPKKPEKV